MSRFIDIHSHILPGLDDGAQELSDAIEMAKRLVSLGFSTIHPTPHQKSQSYAPTRSECHQAAQTLQEGLNQERIPLTIADPAAENMWDDLFMTRWDNLSFPLYQNKKAFLIEFSLQALPPKLIDHLFSLRMKNLLPVIAHVERYPQLVNSPKALEMLRGKSALTVNLSSVGGISGFTKKRLARKLLKMGVIHALTTDSHSVIDLEYSKKGMLWVEKKLGSKTLERLLVDGPAQIVNGELPD